MSEHELPQPGASDQELLSVSEELDEDQLDVDPLEKGVEPPERWSRESEAGVTPREMVEGETLDQRLAAEQPERVRDDAPDWPPTEVPLEDLDTTVDEVAVDYPVDEDGVSQGDVDLEEGVEPDEGMELQPSDVGPTGEAEEDFTALRADPTGSAEEASIRRIAEPE
ncbi:hypothetical protein FHR81_004832 [Actinoalloteichus hoggarensis]|uniref:Uncharacterized protein n=1 Tax=Actinoalloteichus hoggarensis TaxID=1470176 RepID=A0A221W8C3_9PSEU|nr:hypothetical protein [Actinoalloteichus hoggarensis]ASO22158.1 hypothetical protein AHOG_22725 [Actinoalloteichus hoggarensis]MBB5923759.1 hypothetical protein [Actinoalloteichus hoggarensis]